MQSRRGSLGIERRHVPPAGQPDQHLELHREPGRQDAGLLASGQRPARSTPSIAAAKKTTPPKATATALATTARRAKRLRRGRAGLSPIRYTAARKAKRHTVNPPRASGKGRNQGPT